MKWRLKLLILAAQLLLVSHKGLAQPETLPVQTRSRFGVVEEYSVLKTDKMVRQGSYVRYHLAGLAVYEAGSYERGLREGEWRSFSEYYPWNKLLSKGTYRAGLPEGRWTYYYPYAKAVGQEKQSSNALESKTTLRVDVDDTTAVLQAKGLCYQGARVGIWKYYSATGQLIQAINHSANQLLYWQPATGQPMSGDALAANHPLLYVGGKGRLQMDISNYLDLKTLLSAKQAGSAVFQFSVDSTSRQTRVALAENMLPNKYEALILKALNNVTTQWLPQVVNGHPVAATYQVRIIAKLNENRLETNVEALGD